jgi:hypothetical protein
MNCSRQSGKSTSLGGHPQAPQHHRLGLPLAQAVTGAGQAAWCSGFLKSVISPISAKRMDAEVNPTPGIDISILKSSFRRSWIKEIVLIVKFAQMFRHTVKLSDKRM